MNQPKGPATTQPKNAMQLALERAGVATPPEKVVELRNVKDIARAVRYANEELQTHLQLGTADTAGKRLLIEGIAKIVKDIDLAKTNRELVESVDDLLRIVTEMDEATADLLSGAEAQIAELAGELEGLQSGGGSTPSAISISIIDNELKRRGEESKRVQPVYDALVGQLTPLENELELVEKKLSSEFYSSENRTLTTRKRYLVSEIVKIRLSYDPLASIITDNNREVDQLRNYRNAMEVVKLGLPSGLIGKKLGFGK